MKKTFIKLCSVAAIGLALTACNNDAANKTAIESDNKAVDEIVQNRIKSLDDSLSKVCDDKVTAAVSEKIDSLAKAGHKNAQAHVHNNPPATPKDDHKKDEPKKDEPKPGGLKGKSDQTQAAPGGGGLKAKSDQAQTAAPKGGGGLRGKRDQQ